MSSAFSSSSAAMHFDNVAKLPLIALLAAANSRKGWFLVPVWKVDSSADISLSAFRISFSVTMRTLERPSRRRLTVIHAKFWICEPQLAPLRPCPTDMRRAAPFLKPLPRHSGSAEPYISHTAVPHFFNCIPQGRLFLSGCRLGCRRIRGAPAQQLQSGHNLGAHLICTTRQKRLITTKWGLRYDTRTPRRCRNREYSVPFERTSTLFHAASPSTVVAQGWNP